MPTSASADLISTGNAFFVTCEKKSGDFFGGVCVGYVMGLSTMITPNLNATAADFMAQRKLAYCTPDGVTNGQYLDVVLDFLRRNPKHRHQYMPSIFVVAMSEAFPCKDGTYATFRDNGYQVKPGPRPQ
ncbi:Rap1a/Tai family immunity protein [Sphingopyxis sp. C-1]|uniref:Rap1a/Tai family immunity protein n=1 Tax=Sphingopyxis sp. C-1 TaxID=262667 RepID=UPI000784CD6F|nr:Rap1a/Tai family immunity protein [Sphingopyxis sp. C-1]